MMPGLGLGEVPLLGVQDLGVRVGQVWLLDGVSFDVEPGEAVGVLGPRDSGKTLLLDVISGFVRPNRGRVRLAGDDLTGRPARRIARMGVARSFQTPPAPNGMSIGDAVGAAAVGRGLRGRTLRETVEQALAITGLDSRGRDATATLAPAERRLLAIARVAAAAPRVALFDEPFAGLGPDDAAHVVAALRRLHGLGAALVVTAHDAAALRVVCERALTLRDGRVAGMGRPVTLHHA